MTPATQSDPIPTPLPALGWGPALLALAVVAVWGSNFVVIKFALVHLPPFALATLRYALAVVPAIFLIRRPALPWRTLAVYGLAIGVGQFGLLFLAMSSVGRPDVALPSSGVSHAGGWISPAMASLVVQVQVFFTLGLAMLARGDRLARHQALGLALAVAGLALIGWHAMALGRGGESGLASNLGAGSVLDTGVTLIGLVMVLGAAAAWALGNWVVMQAPRVDMLGFVVWSSLFAVPPLALLSWWVEGSPRVMAGLAAADALTWAAVVWQAVGNTLFGYAAWGWLLSRYAPASVTPMALLVPVFGLSVSAWALGEPLVWWKLVAAGCVVAGLAVNMSGGRWWPRTKEP
jgi:O-acetylserine/cysteine efflux transporter